MKCEEAQELITSLVDNELTDHERYSIEAHLKDCSRCMIVYYQGLNLKRVIRSFAASVKAPVELREKILSERCIFAERDNITRGLRSLLKGTRGSG